jgi:hypothetical protein
MKAQLMLFAGTMAGLALAATPVLSQERPDTPGMQRPPVTTPAGATDFKSAMRMLEGSWQISAKTFGAGGADASQMQGTSTRRWILNQNILQEEVRSSGSAGMRGSDSNFQVREPGSPSTTRPGASMAQAFEGHGMFGFDARANEFQHVWCDSTDSKLCFSTGRYDERTRTFTFQKEGGLAPMPARTTPPPTTPPSTTPPRRPDTTPPAIPPGTTEPDQGLNAQVNPNPNPPSTAPPTPPRPITPSTPPTTQRPGSASNLDLADVQRVVIRIQDENRHTVEYFGAGQTKLMEITYTKGATAR